MGIISSIYNSGYNIQKFYLGEQELNLAYLGEQMIFNEDDNGLNYILYEFYKEKTILNTLEAPVRSAILKGNTMTNYAQITSHNFDELRTPIHDLNKPLEKGKKYTIIMNIIYQTVTTGITTRFGKNNNGYIGVRTFNGVGLHKYLYTATDDFNQFAPYVNNEEYQAGLSAEYNQLMILKGDYTSVDIPYFEGIQSVKMPVLKTAGKNLFDKNSVVPGRLDNGELGYTTDSTVTIFDDGFKVVSKYNYRGCVVEKIKINGSSDYYFSYNIDPLVDGFSMMFHFLDKNYNYISNATMYDEGGKVISTPSNAAYVSIWFHTNQSINIPITIRNVQLEEGLTPSSYESYKSNILMVNEDVTLRSNGDVYDELNLLTGHLTQRIDEKNEVLAQEDVRVVDLAITDQDGQIISKLNSFNEITHISIEVAEDSVYPTVAVEVAVE